MAFTSVNGNAMYGTLAMVIPTIRTAVFSSPTTLGQIVISSIVGNFTSYTITRNGGAESASQTATTYTDTGIANNAQCTYTIVPYIGGIKGAPFTAITNPNNAGTPGQIYTLASPASLALTYVGANSTTTSVYFTWTNLEYSSIRLQNTTIVGGTVTTYTSASGTVLYNSSGKDAGLTTNVQYTYTATVVNGDGIGAGIALCQTTLATCTWASAASPTFSSTTYMGTTLGCTGTFSKAYVTYSPIAGGAPTTGTLINVANTISQAYLFVIYGVTYTFNVFPVNSLNYPDSATGTNFTTNSVAIPADGIVTSASFSSPTALGSITIGSIVGSYEYCFIYRGATYAGQIIRGVTTFTDPTALSNNTQYTYTIKPYDYHDGAGTVFTAITNPNAATPGQIYTLASPSSLSLTYSGANSTTTSVYFTWTNSGYSSIRLQNTTIAGGTITTYTSASATVLYNSSGKDTLPAVNGSYTYTATVVNGDGYYVNGAPCQATLATCTWASVNTPTFSGVTSTGVTVAVGGTYTSSVVTYSGGGASASPASGNTIAYATLSAGQVYTTFTGGSNVTFVAAPVNALGYQSSNTSTAAQQLTPLVTIPEAPTNVYLYSAVSNGSTGITFSIGFTGSTGATSYTAYCGAYSTVGSSSPITISTLLALDTTYTIYVTATNSAGTSGASTSKSIPTVTGSYGHVAFSRSPFYNNLTASSLVTYNDQNVAGNGSSNTLVNAPTASAHVTTSFTRAGIVGAFYAFSPNSTNVYSALGDGGINFTWLTTTLVSKFSFTCWVYPKNWITSGLSVFFHGLNFTLTVGFTSTGFLCIGNGATVYTAVAATSSGQASLNTWAHVGFTYDSVGGIILYLNGTQVLTYAKTGTINLGNNILGSNGGPSMSGYYTTYLFFKNVTLTQEQVQQYMNITNA